MLTFYELDQIIESLQPSDEIISNLANLHDFNTQNLQLPMNINDLSYQAFEIEEFQIKNLFQDLDDKRQQIHQSQINDFMLKFNSILPVNNFSDNFDDSDSEKCIETINVETIDLQKKVDNDIVQQCQHKTIKFNEITSNDDLLNKCNQCGIIYFCAIE